MGEGEGVREKDAECEKEPVRWWVGEGVRDKQSDEAVRLRGTAREGEGERRVGVTFCSKATHCVKRRGGGK